MNTTDFARSSRMAPIALAALAGSLLFAQGARALGPDDASAAAAGIDAARVATHVHELTKPELEGRKAGSAGAALATAYLARAFGEAGLAKLPGEKSYVVPVGGDENVLGLVEGVDQKREAIVLSAHWDGVGTDESGKVVPGADENASGLAALLETARVLGKAHPRRTIIFAAFGGFWDNEDVSHRFRGAKGFLKQMRGGKPEWKAALAPVCEVDLMGLGVPLMPFAPERFFVLGAETSPSLETVAKELAARTTELRLACASVDLVERYGPRDDYEAFRAGEVPFLYLSSGVSKHFHKASDTADTVDPKRVAAAARLAVHAVAKIDALEAAPVYAKESLADGKADATEVLKLLDAALDAKSKLPLTDKERRALELKREKIQDMIDAGEVTARDRALLQDTLAILLLVLCR